MEESFFSPPRNPPVGRHRLLARLPLLRQFGDGFQDLGVKWCKVVLRIYYVARYRPGRPPSEVGCRSNLLRKPVSKYILLST
jgi:hypothetical protein